MLLILITFCVNVLVYMARVRSGRAKERMRGGGMGDGAWSRSLVWEAIRQEVRALLIVIAALCTLFLLLVVYAYVFGPIPPIHEWWN
jgi:hypothetical protein